MRIAFPEASLDTALGSLLLKLKLKKINKISRVVTSPFARVCSSVGKVGLSKQKSCSGCVA